MTELRRRLGAREPLLGFVIVAVFLLVGLRSPDFTTWGNLEAILTDTTTVAIVAIGAGLVIIGGGIDISVGSTLAGAATVAGLLAQDGSAPLVAVLAGIGSGLALGGVNAVLVVGLRIEPIVATLATLGIFRGVLSQATSGKLIGDLPDGFTVIGTGSLLGLPYLVWTMFTLTLLAAVVLRWTGFGRTVYAIGNDIRAARLAGIRVARYQAATYVIAGGFAGVAGVLFAARNGTVLPTSGSGIELLAIAAIVVGGVDIFGGRGTVLGIVLAALLLQMISAAMVAVGVDVAWQNAVVGVTILLAVTLFAVSHGRRSVVHA